MLERKPRGVEELSLEPELDQPRQAVGTLANNLRTLVGGEEVSEFKDGDDQFIVRLRFDEPYRSNPLGMGDLLVPAAPGRTVR